MIFQKNHYFYVLLVLLMLFKIRFFALEGRFWAEEGIYFYEYMVDKDFLSSLFFIFNGHLEFFTNLVVATSTLVSFKYAPLVTTWFSLLFQLIPVFFIIFFREKFGFSNKTLIVLLFIYAFLPSMNEVVANSINLHFHFLLLAFLLVLVEPKNKQQEFFFLVLLFFCGISGIPANFMWPVFLIGYILRKNDYLLKGFIVLLFTSLIQIVLVFVFNDSASNGRVFSFEPSLYVYATLTQSFLSLFIGGVSNLAAVIFLRDNFSSFLLVLGVLAIVFYFYRNSLEMRYEKVIFVFSFILITFASFSFSLGDKEDLVSYAVGGRYFFVPSMIVLVFFLTSYEKLIKNNNGVVLLSFSKRVCFFVYKIAFIALIVVTLARLDNSFIGSGWFESYEKAQEIGEKTIGIWPNGWYMNFHKDLP